MLPTATDVLVVGAGPTGLLLTVELARRGIDVVLIDLHDQPLSWDRATQLHARSLELLDAVGAADAVIERSVRQQHVRMYSLGEELGALDLSRNGSRYPFSLGVSEEITEQVLTRRLEQLGGVVVRGAKLIDLDSIAPTSDTAVATVETGGGVTRIAARWVVGCDGFHGATRRLAGIDAHVLDEDRPWVVFDAGIEPWNRDDSDIHVFWEDPQTALTSLPNRRWRVYVRTALAGDDVVSASLQAVRRYEPDARFVDVGKVSAFSCHTRIADRYRSGRALLAGDAAHVCSPAQGHGMNGGLQDAANLAWKLALVVRGDAPTELLDTYELERRPVALDYLQQGIDSDPLMLLRDGDDISARNEALRSRLADDDNVHHDAVASSEMNIDLSSSPIVHGDGAGATLPHDIEVVASDGSRRPLPRYALSSEHTAIVLAGESVDDRSVDDLSRRSTGSLVDDRIVIRAADEGIAPRAREAAIDVEARARLGVRPGGIVLLLVRPDGYVGLRAASDHAARLAKYEQALLAP